MRKVYTSSDAIMTGFLRGVLEDHAIRCLIKNEILQGATGELPPQETWPEIWVLEDREYDLARRLIEQATLPAKIYEDWQCPACGEMIESQFSECWKCNTSRPLIC